MDRSVAVALVQDMKRVGVQLYLIETRASGLESLSRRVVSGMAGSVK